jgi:hypothetical protein
MQLTRISFLAALCFPAFAAASDDALAKLHPDLLKVKNTEVNVIVRFVEVPDVLVHAAVSRLGGKLVRDLPLIESAGYRIPASALPKLAALREVVRISPDAVVGPAKARIVKAGPILVTGDN